MSTSTPNYNLVLPEGTDTFNPLTFNNNAFTAIDTNMKAIQDMAIGLASFTVSDGIYTIVRSKPDSKFFYFIASADYSTSNIISVDGVTATFRYADGTAPTDNAFRINQLVLCVMNGSIMTLVSANSNIALSNKIGNTNISSIGNGTCTGAIKTVNDMAKATKTSVETKSSVSVTENGVTVTFYRCGVIGVASINGAVNRQFAADEAIISVPDGYKPDVTVETLNTYSIPTQYRMRLRRNDLIGGQALPEGTQLRGTFVYPLYAI